VTNRALREDELRALEAARPAAPDAPPGGLTAGKRSRGRDGAGIARYVVVRLIQGFTVILAAIAVSFLLVNLSGSPAEALGGGFMTAEDLRALERALGYDRPLGERFLDYMGNALQGDLGVSLRGQEPVLPLVLEALPYTIYLVAATLALALAVAIPVSLFSVLRRESHADRVIRRVLMAASGVPDFWLALMLALIFAAWLQVLPSSGFSDPAAIVLPTLALAVPLIPTLVRLLRGDLLDIMSQDFIVALRARGLTERQVVVGHALRNAVPAMITFLALQIGWLLGGTLVVETIFGWPGIGSLAMSMTKTRDLPVIQAIVVVVAVAYVALNLLADLLVLWMDPRTRRRTA
jgi:peptide/nickel transport system permease protein